MLYFIGEDLEEEVMYAESGTAEVEQIVSFFEYIVMTCRITSLI